MKRFVREGNYHFLSSASKARLVQVVRRCYRELLSYDRCSVIELKRFCTQRRIQVPNARQITKGLLVVALETADEATEFAGFMELPPELRLMIYTPYFDSLDAVKTGDQSSGSDMVAR